MSEDATTYGGPAFAPRFADGTFRSRIHAPVLVRSGPLPRIHRSAFITNRADRFSIKGDYKTFREIVDDMRNHAGAYEPIPHWHISNAGNNGADVGAVEETSQHITYEISPSDFEEKYGALDLMLDPFVGRHGMLPATNEDAQRYAPFLRAIDHLGLVEQNFWAQCQNGLLRLTDLGSLLDANLALGYVQLSDPAKVKVIEIGGGYGRLAEVFVNILRENCHYVLADSVPASLMYAYEYLKRALPEFRIGSYYRGDAYNETFAVYIVPTWELKNLANTFDVGVNIESFQEMNERHIDLYVPELSRRIPPGGVMFLSNSWMYLYKGPISISNQFRTVYLQNTPRSWTPVHPTHVLQRGEGNFSDNNIAMLEHFRMTCG